jgi:hypothetical protein
MTDVSYPCFGVGGGGLRERAFHRTPGRLGPTGPRGGADATSSAETPSSNPEQNQTEQIYQ